MSVNQSAGFGDGEDYGISNYGVYDKNSMVHLDVNGATSAGFVFTNNNAVLDFNTGQSVTLKGKLKSISRNIGKSGCSFSLDNSFKVN